MEQKNSFTPKSARTRATTARFGVKSLGLAAGACALVGLLGYGALQLSSSVTVEQDFLTDTSALEVGDQLAAAQSALGSGNLDEARAALEEVVFDASEYRNALLLLAQIDIAEGDVQAAIEHLLPILLIEPDTPQRYYQLGVLYTAAGQPEEALFSYNNALSLDPQFANARYFRALLLAEAGNEQAAIAELKIVQETNQNNEQLNNVITQLETASDTDVVTQPE